MAKEPVEPQSVVGVLEMLPPFPIVLVTTRTNVLTINQIHYFTFRPLRIGIAVAHVRHSHGLVRQEREFVVNVPGASLVEAVRLCGSASGRDRDKFEAAGLEREPSCEVEAVSIRQCPAHVECRVVREIEFENRTWFVGDVVAARRVPGHAGAGAILCGRHVYVLPGDAIAQR